jgi:Carbohydrate-binding family 9
MIIRWLSCLALTVMTAMAATAAEPADGSLPRYEIRRVTVPPQIDGRLEEPAWFAAEKLSPFHFPWLKEGNAEQTVVKLLWDDAHLYVAHVCEDTHITARYRAHNDPIPQDDCFEIMFAPHGEHPESYFNIEWNVLGGYIDGRRPEGPRGPRVEWDVEGMRIAGSIEGTANDPADSDRFWTVELAIPFRSFASAMPHVPPRAGDPWRANFNRHGGEINPQYSQWSPGDSPTPAFHAPHRFGTLLFSAETIPFTSPAR